MFPSPQVRWRHGWIGTFWLTLAATLAAPVPTPKPTGDEWLSPVPATPVPSPPTATATATPSELLTGPEGFASLRAEIRGARVKVNWTPSAAPVPDAAATLVYSTDPPGHWAVRDWRSIPMQRGTHGWNAALPVACLSVPVVYFVRATGDGPSRTSPPRIFRPLLAGLEDPTHPFTGFLDGFEHGIEGWTGATGREPDDAISHATHARSGTGALRLRVPSQRSSIAAGCVRLRGWMLWEFNPTALRLSVRAPRGQGLVRCSLVANARTPEVQVFPDPRDHPVDRHWSRLEIPIANFGALRRREIDWMTIQFLAEPGDDLLVDDVELVLP